ncbi:MAG: hypothetical protein NC121_00140 [Blautia sp.]|nr:hypothetical protein [Blautia sp.]
MEDASCTTMQTCTVCGAKKIYYNRHEFTDWDYKNNNSCIMVRYCRRCGLMQYGEEKHQWRNSVIVDGAPKPKRGGSTYYHCLESAIQYTDAQISKHEDFLKNISYNGDENIKIKHIEQLDELRLKKIKYDGRLKNCNHSVLGDICERCWNVINWGITEEDIKKSVAD